jgi:D-sedoheptulose 7-phosphate isomerase
MNSHEALKHVVSALDDGAVLRNKVGLECGNTIVEAASALAACLAAGGKVLLFGNGGSAADAQHLAAEFVGRFVRERRALPAIAFTTDSSILTAVGNDYGFDRVFARQIEAFGSPGDVAIGITTSGNSPNVIIALKAARASGLKTVGLAGRDGGALKALVDFPIIVPSSITARIQECHLAIEHLLCELVEEEMFGPHSSAARTPQTPAIA